MNHGVYSDRAFGVIPSPDFAVVDQLCLNGTCSDGSTLNEAGSTGKVCDCLQFPEEQRNTCRGSNPSWAKPYMYEDCRAHSFPLSKHFLSSAVPWGVRDHTHAPLLLRSYPFVLGSGPLTFWMFGGCKEDCTDPASYYLKKGSGPIGTVTGVALRTTEDGVRIAVATSDNEHEWQQDTWTTEDLAPFVGKEVTIDIHDSRSGAWGWFSIDDFEVPIREYEVVDELLSLLLDERLRKPFVDEPCHENDDSYKMHSHFVWRKAFRIALVAAIIGWSVLLVFMCIAIYFWIRSNRPLKSINELELAYKILPDRF